MKVLDGKVFGDVLVRARLNAALVLPGGVGADPFVAQEGGRRLGEKVAEAWAAAAWRMKHGRARLLSNGGHEDNRQHGERSKGSPANARPQHHDEMDEKNQDGGCDGDDGRPATGAVEAPVADGVKPTECGIGNEVSNVLAGDVGFVPQQRRHPAEQQAQQIQPKRQTPPHLLTGELQQRDMSAERHRTRQRQLLRGMMESKWDSSPPHVRVKVLVKSPQPESQHQHEPQQQVGAQLLQRIQSDDHYREQQRQLLRMAMESNLNGSLPRARVNAIVGSSRVESQQQPDQQQDVQQLRGTVNESPVLTAHANRSEFQHPKPFSIRQHQQMMRLLYDPIDDDVEVMLNVDLKVELNAEMLEDMVSFLVDSPQPALYYGQQQDDVQQKPDEEIPQSDKHAVAVDLDDLTEAEAALPVLDTMGPQLQSRQEQDHEPDQGVSVEDGQPLDIHELLEPFPAPVYDSLTTEHAHLPAVGNTSPPQQSQQDQEPAMDVQPLQELLLLLPCSPRSEGEAWSDDDEFFPRSNAAFCPPQHSHPVEYFEAHKLSQSASEQQLEDVRRLSMSADPETGKEHVQPSIEHRRQNVNTQRLTQVSKHEDAEGHELAEELKREVEREHELDEDLEEDVMQEGRNELEHNHEKIEQEQDGEVAVVEYDKQDAIIEEHGLGGDIERGYGNVHEYNGELADTVEPEREQEHGHGEKREDEQKPSLKEERQQKVKHGDMEQYGREDEEVPEHEPEELHEDQSDMEQIELVQLPHPEQLGSQELQQHEETAHNGFRPPFHKRWEWANRAGEDLASFVGRVLRESVIDGTGTYQTANVAFPTNAVIRDDVGTSTAVPSAIGRGPSGDYGTTRAAGSAIAGHGAVVPFAGHRRVSSMAQALAVKLAASSAGVPTVMSRRGPQVYTPPYSSRASSGEHSWLLAAQTIAHHARMQPAAPQQQQSSALMQRAQLQPQRPCFGDRWEAARRQGVDFMSFVRCALDESVMHTTAYIATYGTAPPWTQAANLVMAQSSAPLSALHATAVGARLMDHAEQMAATTD